jgi:YfiH family protein
VKRLTTSLKDIPWVRHGFFTRQGGVSAGIFDSLNCGPGSGDDAASVAENRARVARELGVGDLVTLWQVHSADVVIVDKPLKDRPQADALVTAQPNLAIAVLTADCAPVLFASRKDKIVAATHAGWKGAVGGVLEATIERMKSVGVNPADISAAIGPCIGPKSYEVGADFLAPFLALDKANEKFFRKAEKSGHMMFDLPAYVAHRLRLAGITQIEDTRQDTLADEKSYFSYRRSCIRGEKDYGRQISVIAIASGG